MIDIETLGTKPGCAILSIAAVPFGLDDNFNCDPLARPPAFFIKVNPDSCEEVGLVIDPRTVAWWKKQSRAAADATFGGTTHIKDALLELTAYIGDAKDSIRIWGNGASFDVPILESAYYACDLNVPWKYYNSLCYRTIKSIYKAVLPSKNMKVAHSALDDALTQARHMEEIARIYRVRI